jgi:hypothetical protein
MPRRRAKPHPSTLRDREADADEQEEYGGHPEHGEVHPDFMDDREDDDEDADGEADDSDDRDDDDDKPLTRAEAKAIQREMDALKQTNAALIRQAPPREPEPDEDEDETDWDTIIFSNPKEAVRMIKEQTRKEVSRELRGEYQKDQGEKEFWADFNKSHPDLKEDRDLVEIELSKNMKKLDDMPVKKAMDELADLTRKRIMRYSGGKARTKSRAIAEGAGAPSARKAPQEKKRATTLSDVLRARAETRRKAQTTA